MSILFNDIIPRIVTSVIALDLAPISAKTIKKITTQLRQLLSGYEKFLESGTVATETSIGRKCKLYNPFMRVLDTKIRMVSGQNTRITFQFLHLLPFLPYFLLRINCFLKVKEFALLIKKVSNLQILMFSLTTTLYSWGKRISADIGDRWSEELLITSFVML